MAAEAHVLGVPETIAILRRVEPKIAYQAIQRIKAPAGAAAAKLTVTAQQTPLSKMEGGRPPKVSVRYGGKKRPDGTTNLVSIALVQGRWSVASDMARIDHVSKKTGRQGTMVRNLKAKYGPASLWVYPVVERYRGPMVAGIQAAVKVAETEANAQLRKIPGSWTR